MDLITKIDALPNKVEVPVLGVTVEELNTIKERLDEEGFDMYDPSLSFREKIVRKYKHSKIVQLNAVYYMGWEMDNWSAIVENKKGKFKVTTSHGWMSAKRYV